MLKSPVSTEKPEGVRDKAEDRKRNVVPEFSTFMMSSGVWGRQPLILNEFSPSSILAPNEMQPLIVASVSLECKGFQIVDSPSAKLASSMARWV
jgi:hypothetical protein